MNTPLSKERLQELIEASRKKMLAEKEAREGTRVLEPATAAINEMSPLPYTEEEEAELEEVQAIPPTFQWNLEQMQAIGLAREGKSFCLIGAAGTGKTTTEKEIARVLVSENLVPLISMSTKFLIKDLPGIVFTSFTRRAVRNMKRVVSKELKEHCITLHKLLEYEPVFYDVLDPVTQEMRKTMRFEPQRNNLRKLPSTLKCIVIDESSMVSVDLFMNLIKALPNPNAVQFIFVGDLHQLPPVYGSAILGFKLLDLPTIELTQIYRQAAKSPIISLAHKIKNGEDIPVILGAKNLTVETEQGKVTLHPWKKAISDFDAAHAATIFLRKLVESGNFNEEEDVILCPQEKVKNTAFGTNEFNKTIAQALGEQRSAIVFEIIAGYVPHYYAVGDRILVGREDAVIQKITRNARYWGKSPRTASVDLDRWGNYKKKVVAEQEGQTTDEDIDKYLESFSLTTTDAPEERKQEASHIIEVELLDSGIHETLSTAGEINAAQFAYCLTVHKSQGSEWNRVFFLTHQSHVVQWSRELLYTAVTRARKELYCIIEPDRGAKSGTLTKAARSPRIKGNTLTEKAEWFKGKQEAYEEQLEAATNLPQGREVEGKNVEREEPTPKFEKIPEREPVKLIRLCEFVSASFKAEANLALEKYYQKALSIFGERIGPKPEIDYNLQRQNIIGLASYLDKKIYLNPLYCILADESEIVKKEMIEDTLIHELCHFINQNYSQPKGKGHDGGWVMAMKLMGVYDPKETYSDNTLPSWTTGFKELVERKQKELAEQNAELKDDTNPIIGAEA